MVQRKRLLIAIKSLKLSNCNFEEKDTHGEMSKLVFIRKRSVLKLPSFRSMSACRYSTERLMPGIGLTVILVSNSVLLPDQNSPEIISNDAAILRYEAVSTPKPVVQLTYSSKGITIVLSSFISKFSCNRSKLRFMKKPISSPVSN